MLQTLEKHPIVIFLTNIAIVVKLMTGTQNRPLTLLVIHEQQKDTDHSLFFYQDITEWYFFFFFS